MLPLSTETSAADKIVLGDFSPIPPDSEPANLEPLWCSDCGRIRRLRLSKSFMQEEWGGVTDVEKESSSRMKEPIRRQRETVSKFFVSTLHRTTKQLWDGALAHKARMRRW